MITYLKRIFFLALTAAVLLGCAAAKDRSFLLDMENNKDYPAAAAPELVVQVDDCLGIHISCENPALAAPFNLIPETADAEQVHTYLVNKDGMIDFPVLGALPVAGKTLNDVKYLIAERIRNQGLIRNPIVLVTLENFTVTVIGEAGNNVLPVKGNSINLFQVVAKSAPINESVKITDVMVIRTEDGIRRSYSVNLQSKDLFESPVFYLHQNDVVYFKPQGTKLNTTGQFTMTFVATGLTMVNIIVNTLLWAVLR